MGKGWLDKYQDGGFPKAQKGIRSRKNKDERYEALEVQDNTYVKPIKVIVAPGKNKTDEEIAEERKAIREKSDANVLNQWSTEIFNPDNYTRENMAEGVAGLESAFRVSDEPNFFDDYLNPLNMVGGMAASLGQAPLQAEQSDSVLPYVTSIGVPLTVGALGGLGTQNTGQFVNNLANPLAGTGDLINNLGNKYLPNAYKLNPNAFKSNPESYYRMIGDEGLADLKNVGYVRSNPNTFYKDKHPFFSKGYPIDGRIGKSVVEDSKYLGNNMIEVGGNNEIGNRFVKNRWADVAPDPNIFVARDKIGIDNPNLKVYQKDWLQGYKQVEVPKTTQNFNSEINWKNWNKEIPENKALMQEYHSIEQQAKANGTWMKNPDGSKFAGTPEQFVQQNSKNFKKAFPDILENKNNSNIFYHGSPETFTSFDKTKFGKSDMGSLGRGNYITDSKSYAELYAKPEGYSMLEQFKNPKGNIYELYANAPNIEKTSNLTKQQIRNLKGKDVENVVYGDNDYLNQGFKGDSDIVVPFNLNLKSAIGNNGMFDMTNPNIYKTLIPGAIGLGAARQTEFKNGGWLDKYQNGGEFIGSNYKGTEDDIVLDYMFDSISQDKGGDKTIYKDFMDSVAYHESAGTMDPTMKQWGGGPGRGKYMIESPSLKTAGNRLSNFFKIKDKPTPSWIKDIQKGKIKDASELSETQQDILFLGDMRMGEADLSQYVEGNISKQDLWADHWWKGKAKDREERISSFNTSLQKLKKKNQVTSSLENDSGSNKYQAGGVIEDDEGQWAHPGEITKINSNNITMKGVNYPVLGISNTGDEQLMMPGEDYKFDGDSVTEYPMAQNRKQLQKLDQLTNFTNYNTSQPGGWLDNYN